MKSKLPICSFFIISILGVLLHFTYDWSGQNRLVGYFSAVNESTWEHLKLLFFPMLFLTIYECFSKTSATCPAENAAKSNCSQLLSLRAISIPSGMLFITVVFYTIWGITGKLIDWVNISIYFLGVAFALYIEYFFKRRQFIICKRTIQMSSSLAICILFALTLLFFLFTYHAPAIGLFYDPSRHP